MKQGSFFEKRIKPLLQHKVFSLVLLYLAMVVIFTVWALIRKTNFLTWPVFRNILNSLVVSSFLTMGAGCLLIAGHIDLSQAAIGAFGSMVLAEFLKYEIPFVKYHYIWKYWLEGPGIRKYYKGYLINEAVKPYTGGDYYYFADEEIYPIFPRQQMTFKLVLKYCRAKNIKLVLYSGASSYCYDIRMHNAVAQLAKECGVDYIDANYDIDKLQIDWSRDTFDGGDHLNLFGARKMTRYLGDYLRAECGLTDHREDPSYQSWHDIQDEYEETVREMEGTSYIILENELKKKP